MEQFESALSTAEAFPLCIKDPPVGSLGCIGRVFFTSLNFPREVWFPVQGLYAKHSVWWVLYLLSQHQHQPSTKAQHYKTNIKVLSRRVILLGGTTKRTRQGLFSKSCLCFAGKENYTCSQRPCCSLFDRLPSPGNSFTHTARHNSMTFKAILIGKAED